MTRYILDTDHLTLLRKGNKDVLARVLATPPVEIAIAIITVEEQFRGWFTQVRQARDAARLARAYEGLFDVIDAAKKLPVLPFTRSAIDRYLAMKKTLAHIGKQDLAIATIALELNATVVTRNRQDFEQVPNLLIEDWSVPNLQ